MKFLVFFITISGTAYAARLEINPFDQEKLAQLLNRLPETILVRSVSDKEGVRRVSNVFPKNATAFQISCVSEYYDGSPYPSTPTCEVNFEVNDRAIEKNYDQWRIQERDPEVISSLFHAIAPSGETRFYRSGYFDEGTNFEGRRTNIFHYLIQCSSSKCLYRFNEKKIR